MIQEESEIKQEAKETKQEVEHDNEETTAQLKIVVDTNKEAPCAGLKLNLGCGKDYKQGYINIDKYDYNADANWDINHLPLNDRCIAQVICSDVLEHLSHDQVLPVLKELFRVLKLESRLIIIVPDLVGLCEHVIKDPEDEWRLAQLYGHQQHEGQFHRTGFTIKRLTNLLGFAGFNRILLAHYIAIDGLKSIYCEAYKK